MVNWSWVGAGGRWQDAQRSLNICVLSYYRQVFCVQNDGISVPQAIVP